MMRNPACTTTTLLLATSPLFACATSVFAAVIVSCALLVCTTCASIAAKLATGSARYIIATAVSATIVATLLVTLVIAGYSDIVAAFAPQMVLAAFAAALLGASEKPVPIALTSCWQLALVGLLCELVGRGTVLGDYELAFAGATRDWLIRVVDFAPLPPVATPAGALLVASIVAAVTALLCNEHSTAVPVITEPVITEPRSGRRVRVTGHIS